MTTQPKFQVCFANEQAEGVAFVNDIVIANDGWAQLAPFGDYPGTALVPQPDGSFKKCPAIQRVDREAATAMVAKFKSVFQRAKRYLTGCPIYLGHPDVPAFANDYADRTSKGMIVDLALRDDGLYCKPVLNTEGSDLVETKRVRAFSGYWSADSAGVENGVPIFRPDALKSAGLTNKPNLPVHLLNEASPNQNEKTKTSMKKLITWLAKHGISIANEATEEQVETALGQIDTKITQATTLANEKATLANEKQTLTGTITAKDSEIAQLKTDRDTARTNFANERKSRIESLIGSALKDGRLTGDTKADWERRLGNEATFANEVEALGKLKPTVKTESISLQIGERKVEIANANDRRQTLNELVDAEQAKNGGDYDKAYATVQRNYPALFTAMAKPEIKIPKA